IVMERVGVFRRPGPASGPPARWTKLRDLPAERVLSAAAGPNREVAIVTAQHVLKQRGSDWTERPGPPGVTLHAARVAFDASGEAVVYGLASTAWRSGKLSGGVYVSPDGGATWNESLAGLENRILDAGRGEPPSFRAISASVQHATTAYVGFEHLR